MLERCLESDMGKKGRVKSNPYSKIDPIMPGHTNQTRELGQI
jgi:hypothetical protein